MAAPRCYLLELPPELRLRIYEELFPPGECYLEMFPAVYMSIFEKHSVRPVTFLRTCRQIKDEATPVLYKPTIFDITIGTPWLNHNGEEELCSIQDFRLGGPMDSVHLRAPDPEAHSDEEAEECTRIIDSVLSKLDNCASAQRVHIEDNVRWTLYGNPIKRIPRSLQRFEALQCRGVITMSLINHKPSINLRGYQMELAEAGTCAEFDELARHLGVKTQLCTWHRKDLMRKHGS